MAKKRNVAKALDETELPAAHADIPASKVEVSDTGHCIQEMVRTDSKNLLRARLRVRNLGVNGLREAVLIHLLDAGSRVEHLHFGRRNVRTRSRHLSLIRRLSHLVLLGQRSLPPLLLQSPLLRRQPATRYGRKSKGRLRGGCGAVGRLRTGHENGGIRARRFRAGWGDTPAAAGVREKRKIAAKLIGS